MSRVLNRNQIVKITATIAYTSVIEIYIKKEFNNLICVIHNINEFFINFILILDS